MDLMVSWRKWLLPSSEKGSKYNGILKSIGTQTASVFQTNPL